jgi:hypothetical protein
MPLYLSSSPVSLILEPSGKYAGSAATILCLGGVPLAVILPVQ